MFEISSFINSIDEDGLFPIYHFKHNCSSSILHEFSVSHVKMLFMLQSALYLIALLFLRTVSATPIHDFRPKNLTQRADWPTNVAFMGGSESYGFFLPPDGNWRVLSSVQCLAIPSYALGPCDSPSIDQIGVQHGEPCSFVGIDGWNATLSGTAGEGWTTVGPPQRIVWGKCGG